MTYVETYVEVGNLVFAGTGKVFFALRPGTELIYYFKDTTSTTLTYLFWELARYPEWQKKLHEELVSSLPGTRKQLPSYRSIAELPILDANVSQAVVSMQCYTTQRDPSVFPDPDLFEPSRWLEAAGGPNDEMKEMFMPFSKGTRACLGKSLALMELKLVTAVLVQQYAVALAPNTTEESMKMTDHFLVLPKSGRCDLIFSTRK